MPGNSSQRILVLNHWAKNLGGAEFSLIDILRVLAEKADVHLVATEDGPLLERLRLTGIRCTVIPCTPNLLNIKRDRLIRTILTGWKALVAFLVFIIRLRTFTARLQPDCIYANVPKSHVALFLLLRLGIKCKGIVHMREIFGYRSAAYYLYNILFKQSPTRIIAISQAVKQALPPRLAPRASVIYNGITIDTPLSPDMKPRMPPVRFLYLGRIVPWKGCHLLIEAFGNMLKHAGSGAATLTLVGPTIYWDHSYREELHSQIAGRGLESTVTLNDHTDNPLAVMNAHHVLCMASENEPFGRVAAEAMGCGLPVVALKGGAMAELVVDKITGLLTDDGAGLSEAMVLLANNTGLITQMGEAGRARATRLFNRGIQLPQIVETLLDGGC
jgi:glycosyltransferase involved in cell wall biosynthesis